MPHPRLVPDSTGSTSKIPRMPKARNIRPHSRQKRRRRGSETAQWVKMIRAYGNNFCNISQLDIYAQMARLLIYTEMNWKLSRWPKRLSIRDLPVERNDPGQAIGTLRFGIRGILDVEPVESGTSRRCGIGPPFHRETWWFSTVESTLSNGGIMFKPSYEEINMNFEVTLYCAE